MSDGGAIFNKGYMGGHLGSGPCFGVSWRGGRFCLRSFVLASAVTTQRPPELPVFARLSVAVRRTLIPNLLG